MQLARVHLGRFSRRSPDAAARQERLVPTVPPKHPLLPRREALGDLQRRVERLAQEVAGLVEQERGLEAAAEAAAAQAAARQEDAEVLRELLSAEAQAVQVGGRGRGRGPGGRLVTLHRARRPRLHGRGEAALVQLPGLVQGDARQDSETLRE